MNHNEFLTNIIPIKNKKLKKILERDCVISKYKSGETINEVGKIDYYVRFLITGAVRGFVTDKNGVETTMVFLIKPGEVIAGSRLLDGSASEIGFVAVKDSEIFSVPISTLLGLKEKFPEIIDLQMNLLAQTSLYHWETKKMLYLKTAMERYEYFLENFPGIIDCVQHSCIASFLNITPVTLSRIRQKKKQESI